MNYIPTKDTKSPEKFKKRFSTIYIVGIFILFLIIMFLYSALPEFLPFPIHMITYFLITILVFWKVNSLAIEKSLLESNITKDNIKATLTNIYGIILFLFIAQLVFTFLTYDTSSYIFLGAKPNLFINLIIQVFATIVEYGFSAYYCKLKLEQLVLDKKPSKNVYLAFIIIILFTIVVMAKTFNNTNLFNKNNINVNSNTSTSNSNDNAF